MHYSFLKAAENKALLFSSLSHMLCYLFEVRVPAGVFPMAHKIKAAPGFQEFIVQNTF
jgi:hypothetical protein